VLRLEGLTKRFNGVTALDGLSLHVHAGEIFGLLGPNGAGKTTSVNMAVGLLSPDAGSVRIDGKSPAEPDTRRRIGVAPQRLALYDQLTASENLEFFASLYGMQRAQRRRRAHELLQRVGLEDRAKHPVHAFSGGMLRRLNLAAALMHEPDFLLLDEPTAGVDPQSRRALLDLVDSLRSPNRAIVITTHYMEDAQRLCDRVGVIDHGKALEVGTIEELIHRHGGHSTITLQRRSGTQRVETQTPVAELVRLIDKAKAQDGELPISFACERPTLEDVFLHLTGRSLRD